MSERILILAGTGEARQLANVLAERGHDIIMSLAGVTREPALSRGKVRRGGFGGEEGLLSFLGQERMTLVIDATHPFAAQISKHAHGAAQRLMLPLMRLERPAWKKPQDGHWREVQSLAAALALIPEGSKVLVTTGRRNLHLLRNHPSLSGVVRSIEPPDAPLPSGWTLMLERPPHSIEHERELMRKYRITHLISKNAGGTAMLSKIKAANGLGIEVLMIGRPEKPQCLTYPSVEALVAAMGRRQRPLLD